MIKVIKITQPECERCMGSSYNPRDCEECVLRTTEIILCKDCKFTVDRELKWQGHLMCGKLHGWVKNNDFCAWGERKSEVDQ